jgi:hypothetical protein
MGGDGRMGELPIMQTETGWTTDNEISYIEKLYLGTYPIEFRDAADPKTLLTNYTKWAKKRISWNTWGSVNGYKVLDYAERLLNEED